MSITRNTFKLSSLSLAVLASLNMSAYAADEANAEDEVEVIEVQGFRGSLIKSINDKKFAGNIVDTINAEDVGKTTDQNIADALGRVTGVSIVSRDGEGSQITVRGASANQNNISLNGQQLSSTDFNQAVDLSSFSADILSKLEVVKSPSADHEEGSLGANVNLVTTKPLDIQNEVITGTLQGRYNDFSEKSNYKLQFSGTKKFLDETLGVALTVYDETNAYRKDQYRVGGFEESDIIRVAKDLDGNVISNFRAIQQQSINFISNTNTSDRHGGSLGLQFIPNDDSEVMYNLTYSKQTQERNYDQVTARFAGQNNFVEGIDPKIPSREGVATLTDPQEDWFTVDTDTHTLVKRLQRFGAGDITNSVGGSENTNLSSSLNLKYAFTDTFRMEAQLGISASQSESLPSLFANLQNYNQSPAALLHDAGSDIQEVGYDCTTGSSNCQMVTGTAFIGLGDHGAEWTDADGTFHPAWEDNTNVLTGFNPRDNESFHLGSISQKDTTVEDTIKSAQVDFDFDLDALGITTIEFGGKITSRSKLVDDQNYTFSSIVQSEAIIAENGEQIGRPAGPLTQIRASAVLDESGQEYDDFMQSLGYSESYATSQITTIDVWKALDLVQGDGRLQRDIDNSESRDADIDTQALYLKANFSLFDDRLTGDIGMRYVKTEVATNGYSGGTWHDFPGNSDESEFDWLSLRDLRDTSLPACPQPNWSDPTDRQAYEQKFNRIDGTGWDTSAGPDPSTWSRIEMFDPNGDGVQDACHDPEYAAWADAQKAGTEFAGLPGFAGPGWVSLWRYADVSTSRNHGWNADLTTPNVTWDGQGTQWSNYTVSDQVNKATSAFATSGTHEYSNLLPSLNLNYAFSDELIGRFAISKTMTRPEIEDIRSGFSVNELWKTYWGGGNRINVAPGDLDMFNTKLEPLESNNLDLSVEWYFNELSMISVAVFSKDMSNFVDTESVQSYVSDMRYIEGTFDADTLLKPDTGDAASNYGLDGCMPVRTTTDLGFGAGDPLLVSEDYRDLCHIFNVNKVINGQSAKIKGIELGYQQTYDFLPGFLSGLGLVANYTYQDSEYGSQESTLVAGEFLPTFPVADTPEHSYNASLYWEQEGHQVRLSYRGSTDSLVGMDWDTGLRGRTWNQGTLWNEGRDTLDLSANYQLNDNVSFSFQVNNLTNEDYRMYYTSRTLSVVPVANADNTGYDYVDLVEGNPLEGEATKSRTYNNYKVGTNYRLGVRVNF
ncbi:TonB-dependent receptor domain-containing protein [Algibacillus agarilyticus]|uniref:TonB-dependent receptor domain-containing protein n=1 Tax=Algibacillus agarilyticus TaxID=2234133 RepID=UPI000DCFC3D3|nr:TonB-dependent receptor [Algibacillus agarilyticus]